MTHDQQLETIKNQLSSWIVTVEKDKVGCPILWIKSEGVLEVLTFLKNTEGLEYRFLSDLTAYDDYDLDEAQEGRFVVVYNLFSPQHKLRVRVKTRVEEGQEVPTAISLWDAANWAEREVYDMFGIKFKNHPDLRRILMDVRWQGHPLRKDYSLRKRQIFADPEQIPEHLLKDDLNGNH